MNEVIEIVLFRLKPGVTTETFLASAQPTFDLLKSFPGYIARQLSQSEDGMWVDIVRWNSQDAALHAADQIMADARGRAFGELMNSESIVIHHVQVRLGDVGVVNNRA